MKTFRQLLVLVAMATLALSARATTYFTIDNIQYSTADTYNGTCVAYKYLGSTSVLQVPGVVEYDGKKYRVITVNTRFAQAKSSFTDVILGWGIRTVGPYAFANCTNLERIVMPSSVVKIWGGALDGCTKLQTLAFAGTTLPEASDFLPSNSSLSLTLCSLAKLSLGYVKATDGFGPITRLETNNRMAYDKLIESNGKYYGVIDNAYPDITGENWTDSHVDMTVTEVVSTLAYKNVRIPGSFTSADLPTVHIVAIAPDAANGNTAIQTLDMAGCSYLKIIGESAFKNCTNLTSATVLAKTIDKYAFDGCTSLSAFNPKEGILEYGTAMLRGTRVGTINVPASLIDFSYAADGATQCSSILVDENSENYASLDGILYTKDLTCLVRQPEGNPTVTFSPGITIIGPYAFENCTKITGLVEIPYGVQSVESYAFSGCTGLQKVVIPKSVLESCLSSGVLKNCTGLTDLYLNYDTPPTITLTDLFGPDAATIKKNINLHLPPNEDDLINKYMNVGWQIFKDYNPSRELGYDFSLTLPNFGKAYYSVSSTEAGEGCDGTVELRSGAATSAGGEVVLPSFVSYRNKKYALTSLGRYSLAKCTSPTQITGGDLVTSINNLAAAYTVGKGIWYNENLQSVNLPNVKTIGSWAFRMNSDLESFYFGPDLDEIGMQAFEKSGLKGEVILPYGVKSIRNNAFRETKDLTRLVVPSSVTTLENFFCGLHDNAVELSINVPYSRLDKNFDISGLEDVGRVLVPVGDVEQYRMTLGENVNVQAGAYDFILGDDHANATTHMSVVAMIPGEFTDADGNTLQFDGWAGYVYHPNIKNVTSFNLNYVETDPLTGKRFGMIALGDSVFADTPDLKQITGDNNILSIGHHAFDGCGVNHKLEFTIMFGISEHAFSRMPNCPSVTILTPSAVSPMLGVQFAEMFKSQLFEGNRDDFKFWIDNNYFYQAYQNTLAWDANTGFFASQLRPYIYATSEAMVTSCYLNKVDFNELGIKAYVVESWNNSYDIANKRITAKKLPERNIIPKHQGVILTGLVPGEVYYLEPYEGEKIGLVNDMITSWTPFVMTPDNVYEHWYWDAEKRKFVHPQTTVTLPEGGIYLMEATGSEAILAIDEWTIDVLEEGGNKFDVNGDGSVDVGDVNTVLAAILDNDNSAKYDVNGDNAVDVGDVNSILGYILSH